MASEVAQDLLDPVVRLLQVQPRARRLRRRPELRQQRRLAHPRLRLDEQDVGGLLPGDHALEEREFLLAVDVDFFDRDRAHESDWSLTSVISIFVSSSLFLRTLVPDPFGARSRNRLPLFARR